MENPKSLEIFESERKKTNHSLTAERDKTNRSLKDEKGKAERRTDQSLEDQRSEADQTTVSLRTQADTQRDQDREQPSYNIEDEQKLNDQLLSAERREVDLAVGLERDRSDAAIIQEREKKSNLEIQFLANERQETDQNLKVERQSTDLRVDHMTTQLTGEIAAHTKTKTSLTTRDEFLAIVSHDLRNPIGAVFSAAEMLLTPNGGKKLDPDTEKWIHFIKRNANSALGLIKDILDMERFAQGKLELQLKEDRLEKIIQDSIESCAHAALAKHIQLKFLPPPTSIDLLCDRERISQVILNLIGNAIKFTSDAGMITLSIKDTPAEVQISVRDTGCGIPQEKLESIFDQFSQLESKNRSGLGLGLYISKMLVEAHQGRIWVESKVGQGSTFYFSIPKKISLRIQTDQII